MHLGLIGGIGPAATDLYYRGLVAALAARDRPLEMTVAHASAPVLIANQAADAHAAQAALFADLIARLQRSGAERAAVTSIAGHFCMEALRPISPLPLIDLVETLDQAIAAQGLGRVGVLGTARVMESGVYGRVRSAELVAPPEPERSAAHTAYVEMAMAGRVTEAQREVFRAAGRRLCDAQGAEAVILGGTDLFLAFDDMDPGFPVIDAARIHIAALAETAAADAEA